MSHEGVQRNIFEEAYRETRAPWDIGQPQQPLVEVADQVIGSVLDVGCGTGENALFFAARGHKVVGIDFLPQPIAVAQQKAAARGLEVEFLVHDALQLSSLGRHFDYLIDCGLFHVFSDLDRKTYVDQLEAVTRPGSTLLLLCFSDQEPGDQGPRRVSQEELRAAFSAGWELTSIQPRRFMVRHDFDDVRFSPGGPLAWFMNARRR